MNQGLPALSLGFRYKIIKVVKVLLQQGVVTWANHDGMQLHKKNFNRNMIYWQNNWTWQSVWLFLWWLSVSCHLQYLYELLFQRLQLYKCGIIMNHDEVQPLQGTVYTLFVAPVVGTFHLSRICMV